MIDNEQLEHSVLCYFYFPKVVYWTIVIIQATIFSIISYLPFCIIWWKVNPFNKWAHNNKLYYDNLSIEDREVQQKTSDRVIKFYQYMYVLIVGMLILAIIFNTTFSEICFDSASNIFEQHYIAAIWVLLSYLMVSLAFTLAWTSVNNDRMVKYVGLLLFTVIIHFGFGIVFYWMKNKITVTSQQQSQNGTIAMIIIISMIIHLCLWAIVCKLFGYKFNFLCGGEICYGSRIQSTTKSIPETTSMTSQITETLETDIV